jgi:hypothetical protein
VVVTGPRDWGQTSVERQAARDIADEYGKKGWVIVQGGAKGLDTLILEHCIAQGYRHETMTAKWHEQGRAAGPIRNAKMLALPHVRKVIGFRRGKEWSKGTGVCVAKANQMELSVRIIEV